MAKEDAATDPLSRAMRELWGSGASSRRGPKPAMSVRSIAAAGVALADADGLEAVTMGAVASRLGFTTMSLYRYVESRQDLLAVMVDEAFGPPPKPTPQKQRRRGWRGQVEDWARAEALQLLAHPWVFDVRPGPRPVSPYLVGWMDVGFAAFGGSGLPLQQAASSLLTVDGYVRSHVQLILQFADGGSDTWVEQLRLVLDPDELPAVSAILESGAFEDDSASAEFPSEEFEFGLALLLDGIDKLAGS
jgi:AcrR family transcriptional regulator